MAQASERPRRKRLSWESRCEIVWRIEQGMSPPLAAASGSEPGDRLPTLAPLPAGRLGGPA
jgi:hypothetical protein